MSARIPAEGQLSSELSRRRELVYTYIMNSEFAQIVEPPDMRDATLSYLLPRGKALRPMLVLLSCGALGGDERIAVPLAAAVEVYHTFTLVHDDIIDRDELRRGQPTVHTWFASRARELFPNHSHEAAHFGVAMGILTGDVQQGWAYSLLCDLTDRFGVAPSLVVRLMRELATNVQLTLVDGEALDVIYTNARWETVSDSEIIDMLRKKTAILYRFAATSGASLATSGEPGVNPLVTTLGDYAESCGIAFQLHDDVLGVIGDEADLGKPVGSDIREGKLTLIARHALMNSNAAQRQRLLSVLGSAQATSEELSEAKEILIECGSVAYTEQVARDYVERGLRCLESVPESPYKSLLIAFGWHMIGRSS